MKEEIKNEIKDEIKDPALPDVNQITTDVSAGENAYQYKRLFPKAENYPYDDTDLKQLSQKMTDDRNAIRYSVIPAGYTYLGQFIDHEISKAFIPPGESVDFENMINERSPFFELETLYSKGPDLSPELYEPGSALLKLDFTEKANGIKEKFKSDLPRRPGEKMAQIVDPRNDENLIIAQMQVLLIKFHNAVVKKLQNTTEDLFTEARELVVRHFQWLVLHDYLPRIIDRSVYDNISKNVDNSSKPTPTDSSIPVEFSVAAFRFGHSMVRIAYDWNRIFGVNEPSAALDLSDLMAFTGFGGLTITGKNRYNLPSAWLIDWRRMFEYPNSKGVNLNYASKIDTTISPRLGAIQAKFAGEPGNGTFSLPYRNLSRGFKFNLPSGQTAAKAMKIEPLTTAELDKTLPPSLQAKFSTETPLWYYVLAEAETRGKEDKLGELGSRLVAETIFGLISISPISILAEPRWKPNLGTVDGEFKMTDLLKFIVSQSDNGEAEINPLGD